MPDNPNLTKQGSLGSDYQFSGVLAVHFPMVRLKGQIGLDSICPCKVLTPFEVREKAYSPFETKRGLSIECLNFMHFN